MKIFEPMADYGGLVAKAVRAGNLVFLTGIGGYKDPKTGKAVENAKGNVALQSKFIFEEIKMILEKCGTSLDNLVALNVYVKDFSVMADFREVRKQYIKSPTASTVVQAGLMGDIVIEVAATALVPE
jgi:enamine deaminase RidA (YjgF/YER057c/UK114 family)